VWLIFQKDKNSFSMRYLFTIFHRPLAISYNHALRGGFPKGEGFIFKSTFGNLPMRKIFFPKKK